MKRAEIRAVVVRCIRRVAPEVDPDEIDPVVDLRDQLDIDSMDFLNIVIGIHDQLGVDIPEADYPELSTLDGCVAYLEGAIAQQESPTTAS